MPVRYPVSVAAAGALTAALGFLTSGPAVAAPTAAEAQAVQVAGQAKQAQCLQPLRGVRQDTSSAGQIASGRTWGASPPISMMN